MSTRSEGFGEEVKRRILLGTFALSTGYYDAYYKKALQVKALIKQAFDEAYKNMTLYFSLPLRLLLLNWVQVYQTL